ncbi:MAG: DUF488 domain-containing protein [Anaerolineales bacterium]|nr:DUF488 domain-containing protein [Anaerolineales bacterium]
MTALKIVTIGGYGFNSDTFFATLQAAGVQVFYDIRWRRGMRGADYAFANAQRLQSRLESLGIQYVHRRDLAPSPDIRARQVAVDHSEKVAKRKRSTLSPEFIAAYREGILADFAPQVFLAGVPNGVQVIALFCVERYPAACHRSLLAERLGELDGVAIEHLLPAD